MKLKLNNIEEMISEAEGISFQEACEHPLMEKINKIMYKYVDKKITEAFGDTYIMGNSTGGPILDIDIHNLIKINKDGDEIGNLELI